MKICIAQIQSIIGDVHTNIKKHMRFTEQAIDLGADLIIFPELSITGYEPSIAQELASTIQNPIFDPFQEVADQNHITIGVGMPLKTTDGIQISQFIFQPEKSRSSYSKQLLHPDELPYFVPGNQQRYLEIDRTKIALGICYETLQRESILNAKKNESDLYIASVAKSQSGVEKAHLHFPQMAKTFILPILMSNSIGPSDDFIGAGQSAIWNKNGELMQQLNTENEGLLTYDTAANSVEIHLISEKHKKN